MLFPDGESLNCPSPVQFVAKREPIVSFLPLPLLAMNLIPCRRAASRGSMVVEAALGYGTLLIVALVTLKASLAVCYGQRWTIRQAMTDAFMTRETAIGNRWPFEEINQVSSPWPTYPTVTTTTQEIGKLPGGQAVNVTLKRTKIPSPNNLANAGGTGSLTTNPGAMESWKLQSFVIYSIGNRQYVKARTVLRTR
jgi:hypothetical protein